MYNTNMKTLKYLQQPYTDERLEFNKDTFRYQLTLNYLKSLRDSDSLPYKSDSYAKRRLQDTSQRVYKYIITHSHTANRQVIDFLLNHTENGRLFLIEVLTAQIEADMQSAMNDIVRLPNVNVANGQVLDREAFRDNRISIETEDVIDDSVNYFGVNICCLMPYHPFYFNLVRQYEGV